MLLSQRHFALKIMACEGAKKTLFLLQTPKGEYPGEK